jgi:hypothetical protein
MAENKASNGTANLVVQPFVEFWTEYAKRADDTAKQFLDGIDDGANLKTWQRRWFDAVTKSADAYMRSPMFLQAMKQNTDAAVKLKRQADDLASEIARNANIPTASDISGLFERLHSVEEVILGRLGRIDERLEAIEEKIGVGEVAKT